MKFPAFTTISTLFCRRGKLRSPFRVSGRRRSLTSLTTSATLTGQKASACKILCVGDVHSQWDGGDESAIIALNPDLVLFVGDYGDEDIVTTKKISDFANRVPFGVASVFGNHDAFFTASHRGRQRAPYNTASICRVTEQMQHLEKFDASYRNLSFDHINLSVCGGRSFSWGGPNWKHSQFYRKFMGITSMNHSIAKMKEAVIDSKHDSIIFLSHSGPYGLGALASDPCGKDWGTQPGGDYGDADLRETIENARAIGKHVPLVVFGHMHKSLSDGSGIRTMIKTETYGNESKFKTVMLNAAVVPRHGVVPGTGEKIYNFQTVWIGDDGEVENVEESWVKKDGTIEMSSSLYEMCNETAHSIVI